MSEAADCDNLSHVPIPLIQFQGQSFKITQQAIDFLSRLQGPIGVITIVGKYRTGKSLFLNKVLLKNNTSFKVCPTINSCTKGLWISRQTIKSQHPQTQDMDVIVIDSEGFGAMEETQAYNNKILLFALLLSSYFIYNSVGSIDEKSLNSLNVITNLAKELQSRNMGYEKIEQQFPTFMWVVRDFTLRLVDGNGYEIDSKQYLENALQIQKGTSDAVENKNKIRRMIRHFFRDRDCCTLVRPVLEENQLQKLNQLEDSALRPQFLQQIQSLRQKIIKRVKPKRIRNRKLTGQTFIELANSYVEAINSGSLPNIDSAWKSINNFEISQTIRQAKELVNAKCHQFSTSVKSQQSFIQLEHKLMQEINNFIKKKLTNQSDCQTSVASIKRFISQSIQNCREKNRKYSLNLLISDFNTKYQQFGYETEKIGEIDHKWTKLQNSYRQQHAANPCLYEFLLQHLQPMRIQSYTQLIKSQEDRLKTEISEKNLIKQALQSTKAEFRQKMHEMQMDLYEKQKELTLIKAKTQQQSKIKSIQLGYIEKQLKQYKQDLQQQEKISQQIKNQCKSKDQLISQLRVTLSNLSSQSKSIQNDHSFAQKQLQILKDQLRYKQKQIEQLKQGNLQTRHEIDRVIDRSNNNLTKISLQLQHKTVQYESILGKYQKLQKQYQTTLEKSIKNQQMLISEQNRMTKQQKIYENMFQTLRDTYQSQKQHSTELTEVNKNLAYALKHLQERFQQMQQRESKLKQFKRCFKNSSCMQCQNCSKFFVPAIFTQHLNVCIGGQESLRKLTMEKQQNQGHQQNPRLQIYVKQTLLKDSQSKPYTEYILQVHRNGRTWTLNRRYKQFCDLHSQLKTLLPGVHLSDSSFIVNPQQSTKKSLLLQQRKRVLQKYLMDLASNYLVCNQAIFRQFIEDATQDDCNENVGKLAISELLKSNNYNLNLEEKQNGGETTNRNNYHKTPEEFLKIWNERNLRAKQLSKNKKIK